MSKMNVEVMELLLKDLAANVGYVLISTPFDTPFEEASVEMLPNNKQFIWPVPSSALNDKNHEDFRKMCIESDILDTVCTTSLAWPTDESNRVAILMIDVTRRRRGSIKFVDANEWDISDDTDMAAVCNMLIHDIFPGENQLAFQMNEDAMDEGLDNLWNDQVRLVPACDIESSLLPRYYMPKPIANQGFEYVRLDDLFRINDIEGTRVFESLSSSLDSGYKFHDNCIELKVPAITVSSCGDLRPQKVVPDEKPLMIDLTDKIVLIPLSYGPQIDLDYAVEQLSKESTLRQLPFQPFPDGRLREEDLLGVLIEIPESLKKEEVL